MRIIDFLLVASWLALHVTAPERFCSTPATWPKQPFTAAFRPFYISFLNRFADFEVKVPEQNKTADVFLAPSKQTEEYIKFNGHVSLRISSSSGFSNVTDQTCQFDTNVQSSFMSGVRYWSYYELHEKIYPLNGILKYELIDTNSTVRGMTVHHSRVCFPKEQVLMEFYYTIYPSSGVRISIAGKNIPTIHYDFITPEGQMTDTYHRQIPRGVICKVVPGAIDRRMPSEFRSFSATVVMVYSENKFSTFREEFYDDQVKLASSLLLVLPGSTFQRLFGHRYLRVIRDYNTDLRYVIDIHGGNCTVESTAHSTPSYVYAGPWDPAGVNANKSPGLFDLSVFPEFFYQKTVIERGHDVDVYKASRVDWPRKGAKTTVEILYTTDEWVTTGMRLDNPVMSLRFNRRHLLTGIHKITGGRNKLFGFWYETTAEPMSTDELIPNSTHVYDYKEGVDDFSVFDISACYEQPSK